MLTLWGHFEPFPYQFAHRVFEHVLHRRSDDSKKITTSFLSNMLPSDFWSTDTEPGPIACSACLRSKYQKVLFHLSNVPLLKKAARASVRGSQTLTQQICNKTYKICDLSQIRLDHSPFHTRCRGFALRSGWMNEWVTGISSFLRALGGKGWEQRKGDRERQWMLTMNNYVCSLTQIRWKKRRAFRHLSVGSSVVAYVAACWDPRQVQESEQNRISCAPARTVSTYGWLDEHDPPPVCRRSRLSGVNVAVKCSFVHIKGACVPVLWHVCMWMSLF